MKNVRQAVLGVLAALICLVIVIGSLSLALAENGLITRYREISTGTPSPEYANILPELTAVAIESTPTPPGSEVLSKTKQWTPTTTPSAVTCPPPEGWSVIMVQVGDTLEILAENYNTTAELLIQANCLLTSNIMVGMSLYVPHQPTPTSVNACGAPSTWVYYTIQSGDTLYKISRMFGISLEELKEANCLVSNQIIAGRSILVPNVTPVILPTKIVPTATRTPTLTPAPSLPPTSTKTPTPTLTYIPELSLTPTPTATGTPTPTATSTPTPTPTNTSTPTPTPTATSTPTPTPTDTSTPTPSPSPQIIQ